jgi:hypothetical protein
MQRPSSFKDALKNTILFRAMKKAAAVGEMDQDEITRWAKVPRRVRQKMSAEDVAVWRRQNKVDKP